MLTSDQKRIEKERRAKLFQDYLHSEDYQARLKQRLELNDAGDRYIKARSYIWHLCERPDNTAEGVKFFINNFCYTFNPKTNPKHLPFITFEFQDKAIEWAIDCIEGKKDGLIEKSREMGMTWLIFVVIPVYYWLFRDGTNILVGSYKEALVDSRGDDSIFGKMDYLLEGLPKWMLPKKFNPNIHRTKLRLVNPANNNLITGDTMNPKFGRGSRKTMVLFDELGFWDYAKDAWEASADTTDCRIALSTPHGHNYYAQLREDDNMDVLTLLWKLHPLKDQLWYNYEKERRTEENLAQEVDISYTKSREGKVYPEWNEINIEKGLFPYNDELPLYVGWDFGRTDDTAIIWLQKDLIGKARIIDVYRNTGKNIDFYTPLVTGIISSDGYTYTKDELEIIGEHKEWKRGTHFGDPAGRFVNMVSDETVISVLRNYGIVINFQDRWKSFNLRKSATKRLIMDGIDLNKNLRTDYFDMCIINSSYPKVKQEGLDVVNSAKPKHDGYSHFRSALEYLALGLEDIKPQDMTPRDMFPKRANVSSGRCRVSGY